MNPDKLLRVLGYNNLSIILMQERRHWLMKTDANKQIQDKLTGDIFQGRLENTGSDIVIESKKLPYKYDYASNIKFSLNYAEEILDIGLSALPYSASVNGLMYARVSSISYQYDADKYSNYKIRFTNAQECILPFSASTTSNDVYTGKWIKTTTPPTLLMYDPNDPSHAYTIARTLGFQNDITNVTWYYPLEETLQPFPISSHSGTTYELVAVDNDQYIGNPLFWFTCDQSNVGTNITFTDNIGTNNTQIIYAANEGSSAPYTAKLYVGVDDNGTPDGVAISNYSIKVNPASGYAFSDDITSDVNIPLSNQITFVNTTTHQASTVTINISNNGTILMDNISEQWTYVDSSTYEIDMSYFEINSYTNHSDIPLTSFLTVNLDTSVPFVQSSSEYGYAGMRFYAGNPDTDTVERYPYNLNKWDGLPDWLSDPESNTVQEHGIVYAMHNNANSDPEDPMTSQGAGLIFDPGLVPDPNAETNPDSIGRVYVLSNDSTEYVNNSQTENPKPARTLARICDIPTSAVQLSGAHGLSSTQVVDRKYVRTETSYSVDDKDKLYNVFPTKWVKPSDYAQTFNPVYVDYGSDNKYIFESYEELNMVDMYNIRNNFRITENLNPKISVDDISIGLVTDNGDGYSVGDQGLCIVGGCSFTYEVLSIIDPEETGTGPVATFAITPDEHITEIPIMNFDFPSNQPGQYTSDYGTSPFSGGKGLRFSFLLHDIDDVLPYKGEFRTDLFALVRENTGMYLYTYDIDQSSELTPKPGTWVKGIKLSDFEITSTIKSEDTGVATRESFINSIIPRLDRLPITKKAKNDETVSVDVLQTASCVSVIDRAHSPVIPSMASDEPIPNNVVDLCKFHCDGFIEASAARKDVAAIIEYLNDHNKLRFDSYVLWRWKNPNSMSTIFEYGIVYRGFSNLFTTDTTTKLPVNDLNCDNFVHFNAGTTVVWNVPGIGPMIWAYDPDSTTYEEYRVDQESLDLHVTRKEITYADIDVRKDINDNVVKIVDDDGNYLWNVLSNNPRNINNYQPSSSSPIYQNPPMTPMSSISVGVNILTTPLEEKMKGNWTLVFPRVSSYRLSNDLTHTQFIPKKMECLKNRDVVITNASRIYDNNSSDPALSNDISTKIMVIEEKSSGTRMRVFNSTTETWDDV